MRDKRDLKVISFLTLLTFTITTLGWSAPTADLVSGSISGEKIPAPALNQIHIPEDYGIVEESYQAKSARADAPLVIYVQDAHCIYEAQSNIRNIIDTIQKAHDLRLVAFEGAEGKANPALLRSFPVPDIKERVVENYVRKGVLSGVEYAAIVNEKESEFWGLESMSVYEENRKAFLKAIDAKKRIDMKLDDIDRWLRKTKDEIYSPELKDLFAKTEDYEREYLALVDYVLYLSSLTQANSPQISALLEAVDREKSIKLRKVDEEAQSIIRELDIALKEKENLDLQSHREARKEFKRLMAAWKGAEFKRDRYYFWLMSQLRKLNNLSEEKFRELYPEFSAYIHHLTEMEKIKGETLFREIDQLIVQIKEKLFQNDRQRELDGFCRHLSILRKLAELELDRKEFIEYRNNRSQYAEKNFWKFIGREMGQLEMDDLFKPHLDFYEIALRRDETLHRNLVQALRRQNRKFALVVTGGFHSSGIREKLKKEGISYLLVTPRITHFEDKTPYWDVMRGDISWAKLSKVSLLSPKQFQWASDSAQATGIAESFARAVKGNLQAIREGWKAGLTDPDSEKFKVVIDTVFDYLEGKKASLPADKMTQLIDAWAGILDDYLKGKEREALGKLDQLKTISPEATETILDRLTEVSPEVFGKFVPVEISETIAAPATEAIAGGRSMGAQNLEKNMFANDLIFTPSLSKMRFFRNWLANLWIVQFFRKLFDFRAPPKRRIRAIVGMAGALAMVFLLNACGSRHRMDISVDFNPNYNLNALGSKIPAPIGEPAAPQIEALLALFEQNRDSDNFRGETSVLLVPIFRYAALRHEDALARQVFERINRPLLNESSADQAARAAKAFDIWKKYGLPVIGLRQGTPLETLEILESMLDLLPPLLREAAQFIEIAGINPAHPEWGGFASYETGGISFPEKPFFRALIHESLHQLHANRAIFEAWGRLYLASGDDPANYVVNSDLSADYRTNSSGVMLPSFAHDFVTFGTEWAYHDWQGMLDRLKEEHEKGNRVFVEKMLVVLNALTETHDGKEFVVAYDDTSVAQKAAAGIQKVLFPIERNAAGELVRITDSIHHITYEIGRNPDSLKRKWVTPNRSYDLEEATVEWINKEFVIVRPDPQKPDEFILFNNRDQISHPFTLPHLVPGAELGRSMALVGSRDTTLNYSYRTPSGELGRVVQSIGRPDQVAVFSPRGIPEGYQFLSKQTLMTLANEQKDVEIWRSGKDDLLVVVRSSSGALDSAYFLDGKYTAGEPLPLLTDLGQNSVSISSGINQLALLDYRFGQFSSFPLPLSSDEPAGTRKKAVVQALDNGLGFIIQVPHSVDRNRGHTLVFSKPANRVIRAYDFLIPFSAVSKEPQVVSLHLGQGRFETVSLDFMPQTIGIRADLQDPLFHRVTALSERGDWVIERVISDRRVDLKITGKDGRSITVENVIDPSTRLEDILEHPITEANGRYLLIPIVKALQVKQFYQEADLGGEVRVYDLKPSEGGAPKLIRTIPGLPGVLNGSQPVYKNQYRLVNGRTPVIIVVTRPDGKKGEFLYLPTTNKLYRFDGTPADGRSLGAKIPEALEAVKEKLVQGKASDEEALAFLRLWKDWGRTFEALGFPPAFKPADLKKKLEAISTGKIEHGIQRDRAQLNIRWGLLRLKIPLLGQEILDRSEKASREEGVPSDKFLLQKLVRTVSQENYPIHDFIALLRQIQGKPGLEEEAKSYVAGTISRFEKVIDDAKAKARAEQWARISSGFRDVFSAVGDWMRSVAAIGMNLVPDLNRRGTRILFAGLAVISLAYFFGIGEWFRAPAQKPTAPAVKKKTRSAAPPQTLTLMKDGKPVKSFTVDKGGIIEPSSSKPVTGDTFSGSYIDPTRSLQAVSDGTPSRGLTFLEDGAPVSFLYLKEGPEGERVARVKLKERPGRANDGWLEREIQIHGIDGQEYWRYSEHFPKGEGEIRFNVRADGKTKVIVTHEKLRQGIWVPIELTIIEVKRNQRILELTDAVLVEITLRAPNGRERAKGKFAYRRFNRSSAQKPNELESVSQHFKWTHGLGAGEGKWEVDEKVTPLGRDSNFKFFEPIREMMGPEQKVPSLVPADGRSLGSVDWTLLDEGVGQIRKLVQRPSGIPGLDYEIVASANAKLWTALIENLELTDRIRNAYAAAIRSQGMEPIALDESIDPGKYQLILAEYLRLLEEIIKPLRFRNEIPILGPMVEAAFRENGYLASLDDRTPEIALDDVDLGDGKPHRLTYFHGEEGIRIELDGEEIPVDYGEQGFDFAVLEALIEFLSVKKPRGIEEAKKIFSAQTGIDRADVDRLVNSAYIQKIARGEMRFGDPYFYPERSQVTREEYDRLFAEIRDILPAVAMDTVVDRAVALAQFVASKGEGPLAAGQSLGGAETKIITTFIKELAKPGADWKAADFAKRMHEAFSKNPAALEKLADKIYEPGKSGNRDTILANLERSLAAVTPRDPRKRNAFAETLKQVKLFIESKQAASEESLKVETAKDINSQLDKWKKQMERSFGEFQTDLESSESGQLEKGIFREREDQFRSRMEELFERLSRLLVSAKALPNPESDENKALIQRIVTLQDRGNQAYANLIGRALRPRISYPQIGEDWKENLRASSLGSVDLHHLSGESLAILRDNALAYGDDKILAQIDRVEKARELRRPTKVSAEKVPFERILVMVPVEKRGLIAGDLAFQLGEWDDELRRSLRYWGEDRAQALARADGIRSYSEILRFLSRTSRPVPFIDLNHFSNKSLRIIRKRANRNKLSDIVGAIDRIKADRKAGRVPSQADFSFQRIFMLIPFEQIATVLRDLGRQMDVWDEEIMKSVRPGKTLTLNDRERARLKNYSQIAETLRRLKTSREEFEFTQSVQGMSLGAASNLIELEIDITHLSDKTLQMILGYAKKELAGRKNQEGAIGLIARRIEQALESRKQKNDLAQVFLPFSHIRAIVPARDRSLIEKDMLDQIDVWNDELVRSLRGERTVNRFEVQPLDWRTGIVNYSYMLDQLYPGSRKAGIASSARSMGSVDLTHLTNKLLRSIRKRANRADTQFLVGAIDRIKKSRKAKETPKPEIVSFSSLLAMIPKEQMGKMRDELQDQIDLLNEAIARSVRPREQAPLTEQERTRLSDYTRMVEQLRLLELPVPLPVSTARSLGAAEIGLVRDMTLFSIGLPELSKMRTLDERQKSEYIELMKRLARAELDVREKFYEGLRDDVTRYFSGLRQSAREITGKLARVYPNGFDSDEVLGRALREAGFPVVEASSLKTLKEGMNQALGTLRFAAGEALIKQSFDALYSAKLDEELGRIQGVSKADIPEFEIQGEKKLAQKVQVRVNEWDEAYAISGVLFDSAFLQQDAGTFQASAADLENLLASLSDLGPDGMLYIHRSQGEAGEVNGIIDQARTRDSEVVTRIKQKAHPEGIQPRQADIREISKRSARSKTGSAIYFSPVNLEALKKALVENKLLADPEALRKFQLIAGLLNGFAIRLARIKPDDPKAATARADLIAAYSDLGLQTSPDGAFIQLNLEILIQNLTHEIKAAALVRKAA